MRASPQQDDEVYNQYHTNLADKQLQPVVAQVCERALRGDVFMDLILATRDWGLHRSQFVSRRLVSALVAAMNPAPRRLAIYVFNVALTWRRYTPSPLAEMRI